MTYGWAILIIAIVIAAIFQLNLFNPYTFAPRASPGSCQIMRPNGPGSNLFVSAVGPACTINEIPQYVARFNGNSYINIPSDVTPEGITNAFSVFAWVYVPVAPGGDTHGGVVTQGCFSSCTWFVELYNNGNGMASPNFYYGGASYYWQVYSSKLGFSLKKWQFVGFVVSGNTIYAYSDSVQDSVSSTHTSNSLAVWPTWIGTRGDYPCSRSCINGEIANVQVYNTSLSQPEVQALYQEGIGGAPTNLQNLVGWWPLNGNAKDYSGNNNNGVPTNVIYTSSWTSGYSTP